MAEIRLVIADVDGTLVTPDKVITLRTEQAVRSLQEAGIAFAITSGRPPRGMKMLADQLHLTEPMAAFNGGVYVNPDLSVIREHLLPSDIASKVIDLIARHGLDVWLYTDRDWFVRNKDAPHVAREQWTVKFPPLVVQNFDDKLDRVAKVVGVSDDYDLVARCEKDVQTLCGSRVSAARSQPYYLDVTHPKANKGEVVLFLSELLKIPTDQIATIGDMPNDVLMFKKSGISIAMGNASPEVKREATYVTDTNEQDGFAKAIERFVLQQRRSTTPKSA
ncbi:MAG: Cof-type HAD-IIB family hydrolase [Terriglobales bacterium]